MKRMPAVILMCLLATACGGDPYVSDEAGWNVISADGFPPIGETRTVSGTVVLNDNGCVMLTSDDAESWVVWPSGSTYESVDHDDSWIVLAGGREIRDGDEIEIVGEFMTREGLPDGEKPESMWGAHAGFCIGESIRENEVLRAETVVAP